MLDLQHNVVNILYAIKGFIEGHLSRVEEDRFKSQDEALANAHAVMKTVYEQADRALCVTKKIRRAMRANKVSNCDIEEVSIQKAWKQAIAIARDKAMTRTTEVIAHIPDKFPKIHCNPYDLTEILYCLIDNAAQAMKGHHPFKRENGKLIIRANYGFKADEEPIANITIADTGPGMEEKTLNRLFEPFATTKPLDKGNGLGLCLVKALVRKNNGSITASSFKGCGTTFTLSFSVARIKSKQEKCAHLAITGQ